MHSKVATFRLTLRGFILLASSLPISSVAASLDEQREAFREVYKAAERGDWAPVAEREDLLEGYALWPDLRAAWLRHNLDDEDAVIDFLANYDGLRPARDIHYRFARHLAQRGRHADFLSMYDYHYADAGDATLDCLAANAHIKLGSVDEGFTAASRLWLVGRSQVKTCDPVFSWLRNTGRLDRKMIRERYRLAIGNRDFQLARFLARSLDEDHLAAADEWRQAHNNALTFLQGADLDSRSPEYREQLAHAAVRLSSRDPEESYRQWSRISAEMDFESVHEHTVARSIALWSARRARPGSDELIRKLPAGVVDDEVRRWRIRDALRREDWANVAADIEALETDEADDEAWRYWLAIAYEKTGRAANAMLTFSALANARSYYGFLAADRLGVDYALDSNVVAPDDDALAELAAMPGILRARELYMVRLDSRARAEWNAATRDLDDTRQAQAALLASRWDWHSRAISMAARAGRYDSLELRYPLPHRDEFVESAAKAGIREAWAYGIARSESIFMRDVRSSAGAIGLMQLMPGTGRDTAAEISLPYRGVVTLVNPANNIRLGTWYLGKMHDRFGKHAALATAAYNAGPHRVRQWLPDRQPVDARIWVETIPFNETREYVRRVLTAGVIFEWRLSGQASRLSDQLPLIHPTGGAPSASGR